MFDDFGEMIMSLWERDVCPTCARPNKTLWHRRRCLKKNENDILKQLKENRKNVPKEWLPKYICSECGVIGGWLYEDGVFICDDGHRAIFELNKGYPCPKCGKERVIAYPDGNLECIECLWTTIH